jgi:hypothetical protein
MGGLPFISYYAIGLKVIGECLYFKVVLFGEHYM